MAVKEVKMSGDIAETAAAFNENKNWVRVYFNEDNGFIWWEDEFTCPKANHSTYQNNPNIAVLFEKGNPDHPGGPDTISADEIVSAANAKLA